jgi:L-2-hydroxyglutarate oxidase LhgO
MSDRDATAPAPSHSPVAQFDVAVVGAGILGLAVARELRARHPDLRLVVIDREDTVGAHQTGHNSGVIHSGVYYKPGSLKARLCVEGSRLMYEFCDEHGVKYERCGKLIVALHERELPGLDEIEARGKANGVPGLRRVAAAEIAEIEPECRGIAALHCPSTGIVDYGDVSRAIERELRAQDVNFRLGHRVERLDRRTATTDVVTDEGVITARFVIGCAGLWSDRLAVAAGAPQDPRIVPFRGAYLTLRHASAPVVRGLVYPVPDPELPFLGVHVTRHVNGEIVLGPTAMLVCARDGYRLSRVRLRDGWDTVSWPGTWRMGRRFWRTGVDEIRMAFARGRFLEAAAQYVPAVRDAGLEPGSSGGVRAQALGRDGKLVDDFVISETPGAVHVRNAPSPAATSSLALAQDIVGRLSATAQWPWASA